MAEKQQETLKERVEYLKDVNAERVFFYNILQRVFMNEPTSELMELINDPDILEAMRERGEEYKEAADLIQAHIDTCAAEGKVAWEEARNDYVGTFCFGKGHVYPYESIYVSKKKQLFQDATYDVRNWYFEHDLAPKMLYSDPDDHVGLELDLMRHLADRTIKALEKKDVSSAKQLMEDQVRFLNEHPLRWFSKFSEQAQLKVKSDFYRGFSKLLDQFVKDDLESMKEQYLLLESISKLDLVAEGEQKVEMK